MPPNALLSPKKGGMITNMAGTAIKIGNFISSVIPARVLRIPQAKSIGMLSLRIRLTAASADFRPFMAQKNAARINKIENNKLSNPFGDAPSIFNNAIAARHGGRR